MFTKTAVILSMLFSATASFAQGFVINQPATVFAAPKPRHELVYLTATWCGPCRSMKPIIAKVAESGTVTVCEIDVDAQPEEAKKYGASKLPCFVFLTDDKEVDRIYGVTSFEQLLRSFQGKPLQSIQKPQPSTNYSYRRFGRHR